MTNWQDLSARASLASHRLIGWIYWDPDAIARFTALGVPNGIGYYVTSRAAPLAAAGNNAVTAAFYTIRAEFINLSLDIARQHTTFEDAYRVRNEAVVRGLHDYSPAIVDGLSTLAPALWQAADSLPLAGRVLHGAHKQWPRCEDQPELSAWLAINCIREWRGDTHFAILASEDITGVQAGLLHDAFLGYPGDWIPRSRGADDEQLVAAWEQLDTRGFVTEGRVNEHGLAFRQMIEDKTNFLCEKAWRHLGEKTTTQFCELVEPFGPIFLARIDATAGENWMPAARDSRRTQ
ncbi:MAG: hypothetical protein NWQ79_01045 [Ilumatobacteraceae bacterium]|nr:hypothetical protein [Ilumatobacteraceae bacterium]